MLPRLGLVSASGRGWRPGRRGAGGRRRRRPAGAARRRPRRPDRRGRRVRRGAVSALGYVLVKRWHAAGGQPDLHGLAAGRGGLVLLPVALLVEGAPPALDLPGRRRLPLAGLVGTGAGLRPVVPRPAPAARRRGLAVGLLNPVVGTLLGVALAGEAFGGPGRRRSAMLLVLAGGDAAPAAAGARPPATASRSERRLPPSRGEPGRGQREHGGRSADRAPGPRWTPGRCRCRRRGTGSGRAGWSARRSGTSRC